MQLRNLSSKLQLRDLRQCDYLANYKIYITDSVVVCCTGAETRPILCSVFQNLRLGTHIMTTVFRKNHSPGSTPRVDPFRRSGGVWTQVRSLASEDVAFMHQKPQAACGNRPARQGRGVFHRGAPPRVLRPPPTLLIGRCHIKSTHRIMIRTVIDVPKRGFLKGLFVESSTYCECATFFSLQWHGLGNLWYSIFDMYKTHYLHCTRLWLQGRLNERIASCR